MESLRVMHDDVLEESQSTKVFSDLGLTADGFRRRSELSADTVYLEATVSGKNCFAMVIIGYTRK
jgi:hypothetical protein